MSAATFAEQYGSYEVEDARYNQAVEDVVLRGKPLRTTARTYGLVRETLRNRVTRYRDTHTEAPPVTLTLTPVQQARAAKYDAAYQEFLRGGVTISDVLIKYQINHETFRQYRARRGDKQPNADQQGTPLVHNLINITPSPYAQGSTSNSGGGNGGNGGNNRGGSQEWLPEWVERYEARSERASWQARAGIDPAGFELLAKLALAAGKTPTQMLRLLIYHGLDELAARMPSNDEIIQRAVHRLAKEHGLTGA